MIKSGGRILGPMTSQEVEQALRMKEVVPLDEVSLPFGRWHYIRDEKKFELVVNELRNRRQSSESTITGTASENTATDVTERISAFGPTEKLTSGIGEQLAERRVSEVMAHEVAPQKIASYGYSDDESFRKSVKPKFNIFIWISLFVVVGGLTIKLVYSLSKTDGMLSPSKQAELALQLSQVGEFNEALKYYKKGREARNDNSYLVAYGHSLLATRQSREARAIFQEIIKVNTSPEILDQAKLGMIAAAILELDSSNAKRLLDEFIKDHPNNSEAYANYAALLMQGQSYAEAAEKLLKALEGGRVDASTAVLLAQAEYKLLKNNVSLDAGARAKSVLTTLLNTTNAYRLEALALMLCLEIESRNEPGALAVAEQIMSMDPGYSEDHRTYHFQVTEAISWEALANQAKETVIQTQNPKVLAALGLIVFKGKDKQEGRRILEEAQMKASDDIMIRSALAYVQDYVGRVEEASAGITIALESKSPTELALIVKARQCIKKKDFLCAEEQWKTLLAKDEKSVVAMAGLAETYFDRSRADEAGKLVAKGLAIDPDYIPLLKLDARIRGKL